MFWTVPIRNYFKDLLEFDGDASKIIAAFEGVAGLFFVAAIGDVSGLDVRLQLFPMPRELHVPQDHRSELGAGVIASGIAGSDVTDDVIPVKVLAGRDRSHPIWV